MKLLIALVVGAALYFAQMYLYRRFWDTGLAIDIDFARNVVRAGEDNELIETIYNDKRLPLPVLQVKFAITRTFLFNRQDNSAVTDQYYRNDYFSLLSFQKITRTYGFVCSKRGYFRMNGMDVICKDLFLSGMMLKSLFHEASVCVLPERVPVEEYPASALKLMGEIVDNVKRNEDPFEFAGIREYQSFDPMNRINWKASARASELRVNKFNSTFTQRVLICLNVECHIQWHEDVFIEEGIRIAASLADHFIAKHIPVALYSNGCDIVTREPVSVDAGADASHLRSIETALARTDASGSRTSFTALLEDCCTDIRYDNTECIIISNYRKQDLAEKYGELRNRGVSISWIIPEYGMVEPKLAGTGDKRIIKWTVRNAN